MKNLFKRASLAVFCVALSGCSTMTPPRYSANADNNVALRKLSDANVSITDRLEPPKFDANCRLMGPIEASDHRSVAQFVMDSFNDEFKFANIYGGPNPRAKIQLILEHVEFSSSAGLTNGWWDIAITLKNTSTGASLQASTHYSFRSGFDAITACTQTAQALTPAVQDLIGRAVRGGQFEALVR